MWKGLRQPWAEHIRDKAQQVCACALTLQSPPLWPCKEQQVLQETLQKMPTQILQQFQAVTKREEIQMGHDPTGILGKQALFSQICVIITSELISLAQLRTELHQNFLT